MRSFEKSKQPNVHVANFDLLTCCRTTLELHLLEIGTSCQTRLPTSVRPLWAPSIRLILAMHYSTMSWMDRRLLASKALSQPQLIQSYLTYLRLQISRHWRAVFDKISWLSYPDSIQDKICWTMLSLPTCNIECRHWFSHDNPNLTQFSQVSTGIQHIWVVDEDLG